MSAILAPELPPNIVAVTEIEETPAPPEYHRDGPVCYLCPQDAPQTRTETRCYYCDRPVCATHNPGYLGWCFVQFDACPSCAKRATGNHGGFNGSHRPQDSALSHEAYAAKERQRAANMRQAARRFATP